MKALTRYNHDRPFLWDPFFVEFDRGLDRFFGRTVRPLTGDEKRLWAPATDITEDDKEYVVKAELPEVKKEEVRVTVEGDALRICGERNAEKEEQGKTYHRMERRYGGFERVFVLPPNANAAGVTAEFKDGLLTVRLPKVVEAKPAPRDIAVN
ncbi:MAG: Hsp20/alpha crystallin family protein [Verrucomicrobia bacterium]|nr:Hsp20/alpha crystallin family protein [Verrucomicrobiota bacterium]